MAATGPSGLASVDLDFGTVAVYTCSRSCVGRAADVAEAYAQEAAWVQPAGDEQLHVPDVGDQEAGDAEEQAGAAAATAATEGTGLTGRTAKVGAGSAGVK